MELLKAYLDIAILGTLGFMSFLMVWFAIERFFFYQAIDITDYVNSEELKIALTNNLTTIYTVGANAPYVGLLGTVLGILVTFHDMGLSDNIEVSDIMLGLAIALKATAMGLLVAIPAIIIYNSLLRKTDVLTAQWKAYQDDTDDVEE